MNLLRSLLKPFNRRIAPSIVDVERRGTTAKRMDEATARMEKAVDDLYKTVTMTREELCEMMRREEECPLDKEKKK